MFSKGKWMAKPRQRTQSLAKKLGQRTLDGHDCRRKTHLQDTLKIRHAAWILTRYEVRRFVDRETETDSDPSQFMKQSSTQENFWDSQNSSRNMSTTSVTD